MSTYKNYPSTPVIDCSPKNPGVAKVFPYPVNFQPIGHTFPEATDVAGLQLAVTYTRSELARLARSIGVMIDKFDEEVIPQGKFDFIFKLFERMQAQPDFSPTQAEILGASLQSTLKRLSLWAGVVVNTKDTVTDLQGATDECLVDLLTDLARVGGLGGLDQQAVDTFNDIKSLAIIHVTVRDGQAARVRAGPPHEDFTRGGNRARPKSPLRIFKRLLRRRG